MDWRNDGACLHEDPELFFPIGAGPLAAAQYAAAKQVCQRCPVIGRCLEWALATGPEGIWGGLDDQERRQLRRASRRSAA